MKNPFVLVSKLLTFDVFQLHFVHFDRHGVASPYCFSRLEFARFQPCCAGPMGSCLSAASSSSKDPAVDEPSAYFAKLSIEYLIMFSRFSFCYILFLFIVHDS